MRQIDFFLTAPPQTLKWWVGGFAVVLEGLATHPKPTREGVRRSKSMSQKEFGSKDLFLSCLPKGTCTNVFRHVVPSNQIGTMRMRSMDPPLFLETINNAVTKNNFKHVCAAVVCFICLGSFEIRRVGNTLRDKSDVLKLCKLLCAQNFNLEATLTQTASAAGILNCSRPLVATSRLLCHL